MPDDGPQTEPEPGPLCPKCHRPMNNGEDHRHLPQGDPNAE